MSVDQSAKVVDTAARDARRLSWTAAPQPGARPSSRWPRPAVGEPQISRITLVDDSLSLKRARNFTKDVLSKWSLDALVDDVTTVVSELVSNALSHGLADSPPLSRTSVQLVLLHHQRRLLVMVTDPSNRTPSIVRGPEELREHGRGLLVVEALSDDWGWAALTGDGKVVWAGFELRPTPPYAPGPPGPVAPGG